MRLAMFTAILALLPTLAASPAWARPVAVTVYPDSARIEERAETPVTDAEAVFTLPASADPDSLTVSVSGPARLADVAVQRVARRDEARITDAREQLQALEIKAQDLADARASHLAAADFWRTQAKAEASSANEARSMVQLLRDDLYRQMAKASALGREKDDLDRQIAELKKRLADLTGGAETVWEVRARLAAPKGKALPAKAVVDFAYLAGNCGWTPAYTLDARPDRKDVHLSWEATVRQSTGRDWDRAEITLATARFRGGARPPELRPWVIGRLRPPQPLLRKSAKAPNAMDMAAPLMEATMAAGAEPPRERYTVFDSYDLGPLDLASGGSRRVAIRQADWPAAFDWLVRPQQAPRAFLRATVELKEAQNIPHGPAALLLDGALVRKQPFELHSREAELFFGADPQVDVTTKLLERTEGTAGFVSGRRTMHWRWRVTVANHKAEPVTVRVEDATPRPADEKIEIKPDLGGAAERDNVAAWTLTLAPGAEKSVEYGYTVSWPKDMEVDLGGR